MAKCYRLLRAILMTAVEDELIIKNPCVLKRAGRLVQGRPFRLRDSRPVPDELRAASERRGVRSFLPRGAGWCIPAVRVPPARCCPAHTRPVKVWPLAATPNG